MKALKKVIKEQKNLENQKNTYLCSVERNKSINRSKWNIKNLKIMAVTNWTVIRKNKKNGSILMHDLESKWTYKTALGIAIESNNDETHELICVVETNKIMIKNEKESEKKTDI